MQRHFYATAGDLLSLFQRVESKRRLAYTLTGMFTSSGLNTVYSGSAIPTLLSPAPGSSAASGYSYLVTDANQPVVVREVPQRAGGLRYAVDQLLNPESVTLLPGGIFPPNVLLYGSVGTASTTPSSVKLQRAFASAIGKLFQRVRAYYVGPQALELWHGGYRLTIGADSPSTYDLAA
jgi:hypothetical protein